MTRAHAPHSRGFSFRLSGLFALVLCTVMAGCAGTSRHAGPLSERDIALASASSDPIGVLASRAGDSSASHLAISPFVETALDQLGIRYRYGGASPEKGFDCSGLVAYSAQRSLGLLLPRTTSEIAEIGSSVDKSDLQAGDLVFFNTLRRRYSHVGIYLGNDQFVHAPSSGGVVRIENMTTAYWAKRYNGARRLDDQVAAASMHPAQTALLQRLLHRAH